MSFHKNGCNRLSYVDETDVPILSLTNILSDRTTAADEPCEVALVEKVKQGLVAAATKKYLLLSNI